MSVLMVLTMLLLAEFNHVADVKPNRPFSTFPKKIGDWTGIEQRWDQSVYDSLGVDDSFLATYKDPSEREVNLYVGFYQSQREGEIIHSPKQCMPGSGWSIKKKSTEVLDIPDYNSGRIKVVKLLHQKGTQKLMVLYWYQSRGRIIHSEYLKKIFLVVDSIFRKRTDGSLVRLIAPVKGNDEHQASDTLNDFVKIICPVLNEYIPR